MNPLRVLLWSPGGAGLHYHGPAISTYRLFQQLSEAYPVELTLVHARREQPERDNLFKTIVALPSVSHSTNVVHRYLNQGRYLGNAGRWLRENIRHFDVMYAPTSNALTLFPCATAKYLGLPVVNRVAVAGTELSDRGAVRRLLRWTQHRVRLMRKLDMTIALSDEIAASLASYGLPLQQIYRLPNAANCDRFRPPTSAERTGARARFAIPTDKFVVSCVGAVGVRKGQHLLAEALTALPANAHLLIVGPVRDSLVEADIRRRLLPDQFTIVPHIEDIEHAYFASDVFALPSTDEGMPNAMVEAMACGLPCIGTSISGICDLLADGRGRIVGRTPGAISATIAALMESGPLRRSLSYRARTFVLNHQSDVVIAARLYQLLSRVARRTRQSTRVAGTL